MFDNAFSAAVERDPGPDAAVLMMRDVRTGMWVEYDRSGPPDLVEVVPLDVLRATGAVDETAWDPAVEAALAELAVAVDREPLLVIPDHGDAYLVSADPAGGWARTPATAPVPTVTRAPTFTAPPTTTVVTAVVRCRCRPG